MSAVLQGLANKSSGSVKLAKVDAYITHLPASDVSAIDRYYYHQTRAVTTATPELLATAPWLSGPIMTSMISATELYFREIFSQAISLCPISRNRCSEKTIHMGAILWHRQDAFGRAAFEHMSLADGSKIRSCSRDYLNFDIKKSSNTSLAIDEYDKLCELRHGVVHSGNLLPGKNAVKLMIQKASDESHIQFGLTELHEAIAICTSLVESYNNDLFDELIRRWAQDWRQYPDWSNKAESWLFKSICSAFFSNAKRPTERPTVTKIKNAVKKNHGL